MSSAFTAERWKSSELGEIPEDWEVETLAALGGRTTSGSRGWAKYYADHGDLFVRITNLRRAKVDLDLSKPRFVRVPPTDSEAIRTRLASGDLLISITADIGIVGYVDDAVPQPAYINQHIARVRFPSDRVDSKFIAYYLSSWGPQRIFVGSTDTGAKAGMNLAAVGALKTVVPPRDEQRRIAEVLGDVDRQTAVLERLIGKKEAVKIGLAQELLSGRTRLPGHTDAWETRSIGEFTTIATGGTPSTAVARYWGGSVRWMSSGELHQKRVDDVAGRITEAGLAESNARLVPVGSVLIGLAGQGKTRGTAAINRVRLTTNQSIAAILPGPQHSSRFLYYNLDSRYEELRSMSAGGAGRGGLNLGILRSVKVYMPPTDEQRAIAEVLTAADDELDALRQRLAKANAIKAGMSQALLSGRVRLIESPELAAA